MPQYFNFLTWWWLLVFLFAHPTQMHITLRAPTPLCLMSFCLQCVRCELVVLFSVCVGLLYKFVYYLCWKNERRTKHKKYSKTNRESNKGKKNNTNSIVQRGLTNMFLANSAEASTRGLVSALSILNWKSVWRRYRILCVCVWCVEQSCSTQDARIGFTIFSFFIKYHSSLNTS